MYDIKPAINLSELNQAAIGEDPDITAQREKTLQAQEDYANALEQRFRNPNWMKVSAGFLKPQLGGFGASLGTAFDVLAEQQEQQKAIAPTIAQIRAQTAVGSENMKYDLKANEMLREALAKPNGLTSEDVANIEKYSPRVGKVAQQKFTNQGSTFAQILQAYQGGADYTRLVKDYGKPFVDSIWPSLQGLVPGKSNITGAPTSTSTSGVTTGAPTAPVTSTSQAKPPRPIGVPESMLEGITKGQELATTATQIDERMKEAQKLRENYSKQADISMPIYKVASELYKLGSHDYMKPAFGIFEKGDPIGILGTALEQQNVSGVLQGMRDQIIKSRMNASDKKSAMSDLQSMEIALGNLQKNIQQGVINPTDIRTMFEAKSVPGLKNTQDAFLRGIANIGHEALGAYETNTVFNQFLNRKDADVKNWQQSPEFISLQNTLKKRGQQVMSNPAGSVAPKFLTNGLEQSYKHSYESSPTSGTSKRLSVAEARRLANGEQ